MIEIEDRQYTLDRSELRPHVQAFSGYEVYNERDPHVGPEFNHGYLVGVNATWHLFDGFATKGRMQATRARREAAVQALQAARRSVASEVRSAFLDLQQAENVLESETKNVQTADESLEIAKTNLAAGLGTQLDILQAASDVTRTRTTRLSAIYLHNVALARLARACASRPEALDFASKLTKRNHNEAAGLRRGAAACKIDSAMKSSSFAIAVVPIFVLVDLIQRASGDTGDGLRHDAGKESGNPASEIESRTSGRAASGPSFHHVAQLKVGVPAGIQGGHRAGESGVKEFGFVRGSFTQALFNAAIPPSVRRGDVESVNRGTTTQRGRGGATACGPAGVLLRALQPRTADRSARNSEQRLDENVASEKDRYEAGLVDRSAFTSATVQARELDSPIESAQRAYAGARLKLGGGDGPQSRVGGDSTRTGRRLAIRAGDCRS